MTSQEGSREYHVPVMLDECIDALNINPNGIYVDLTFGGGGHSKKILQQLGEGHLYVFDQDEEASLNSKSFEADERFTFIQANFRYLKKYLKLYLSLIHI